MPSIKQSNAAEASMGHGGAWAVQAHLCVSSHWACTGETDSESQETVNDYQEWDVLCPSGEDRFSFHSVPFAAVGFVSLFVYSVLIFRCFI